MAQPATSVPKYFSLLCTVRFFASGFFLATTIRLGHLSSDLGSASTHAELLPEKFPLDSIRMLRAGLAIESIVGIGATIWALCNILGEATEQLRKSAIIGCMRTDGLVIVFSGVSIALQKAATNGTGCHRSDEPHPQDFAHLCTRFELAFRFTVAMVVFAFIGFFFETRWMINKRLSEARAASDDWAKNHSPRLQPYLGHLQVLAAPIRFLWRCCCKFGHSTKNPMAWGLIFLFLAIPILIGFLIMGVMRALKSVRAGLIKALKCRDQKLVLPGSTTTHGDARCVSTSAFGPGTEMVERPRSPAELAKASTTTTRIQSDKPTSTSRMLNRTSDASGIRLAVDFWRENLRRSPKSHSTSRSTLLENILLQPNLFFELLSHLHGADVRALSTVSKSVRSIVITHRLQRPHATRRYICSRAQLQVDGTPAPDPVHTSSTPSVAQTPASNAQSSAPASTTTTDGASISDTLRRLFGLSESPTDHMSHPCWSCGVIICPSCSKPKPNIRVSKTELRLHSLQPVCSLCYFKALCGPYARQPQRRWPGSKFSQRRVNTRKVFKSLSAKCACTTKVPPRMEHALCRECHPLSETEMWDKRMKRGAVAEKDELPVNALAEMREDSDSSEDEREDTGDRQDVDIESVAASAVHNLTSSPRHEDLDPGGSEKPVLATSIHHCYACHERLWILPSWLGVGKTRGLRWWRCRHCGLEARDVLMSIRREFQ